jgi:hypothetical protein
MGLLAEARFREGLSWNDFGRAKVAKLEERRRGEAGASVERGTL